LKSSFTLRRRTSLGSAVGACEFAAELELALPELPE
jgi:hypothetical protein